MTLRFATVELHYFAFGLNGLLACGLHAIDKLIGLVTGLKGFLRNLPSIDALANSLLFPIKG